MGKPEGKITVITRGNNGMGLGTAKLFVAEGAHEHYRTKPRTNLIRAVKKIGRDVTAV